MRAPLERSSKFLKSHLLECEATTTSSLGAKCVCHYSRPPARPRRLRPCARARNPSAPRAWRPRCFSLHRSCQQPGVSQTLARGRAPSAPLAASTAARSLAAARTGRCAVQQLRALGRRHVPPGCHPEVRPSAAGALHAYPPRSPSEPSSAPFSPHPPRPPAALHSTRCCAVPPNRGRGMKILIKNLSPSRTYCQEKGKHLCPHPQHYLVPVQDTQTPPPAPKETSKM